jgi:cephalosporin hydroxylase
MNYRGIRVVKYQTDLLMIQELIYKVRPRLIIETGTRFGGSALFYADMQKLMEIPDPLVYTIDITDEEFMAPDNNYIVRRIGSSLSNFLFEEIKEIAKKRFPVLIDLDSDHSAEHVSKELALYSPLVTKGSYLIVEDTNEPGPRMAVYSFLAGHSEFTPDRNCEVNNFTSNPNGYLLRI